MIEKNKLIILSDMNLWYGNTAGVIRMKYYAKALSSENKVYLISNKKSVIANFIEVEKNIFVQNEELSKTESNKITKIKNNIIFAREIEKWNKEKFHADSFLIYPSTDTSFEFFLFLFLKIFSKNKVYYELNEIRKFSIEKVKVFTIKKIIGYLYNVLKYNIIPYTWSAYNGLICINKNIAHYAKKYNKKISIIPILSDNEVINLTENSKGNEFTIFFSGTISIRKENLEEFIYGLVLFDSVYQNWKFEFCGPVEGDDLIILHKIIKENKLDNKISYLGNLPHDKVIIKQKLCNLLVLPRANTKQNFYGFSTKLAEYAVSGTPMLITKTGVVTDFFTDEMNCFLSDGYSRINFFNSLKKIISLNEVKRREIASNAIDLAKKYFYYQNYSEELDKFLFK